MNKAPNSQKAFVGVDGGGSKTRALAIDSKGGSLTRKTGTGCNPHNIGFQKAGERIDEVVSHVCHFLQRDRFEIVSVFCGIAGIRTADEKAQLAKSLSRFPWARTVEIYIDSDLSIAYEAALGDQSGICLIAGTGAACIAKDANGGLHTASNRQSDGDEPGSGFGIGRDALRTELLQEADGAPRDTLSKLAETVIRLADQGNTKALGILETNAQSLAELLTRVHNLANLDTAFPIVLTGGLGSADTIFRTLTAKRISGQFPDSELRLPRSTPVEAAARLAMRQWSIQNPCA